MNTLSFQGKKINVFLPNGEFYKDRKELAQAVTTASENNELFIKTKVTNEFGFEDNKYIPITIEALKKNAFDGIWIHIRRAKKDNSSQTTGYEAFL